jgi:hypothetical protein
MNTSNIEAYIQIATVLYAAGVDIAGKFKALIGVFHPDHTLTDEEINAIEQAGMDDSRKRLAERIAMGQA